jgi:hypothetical protein
MSLRPFAGLGLDYSVAAISAPYDQVNAGSAGPLLLH